MPRDKLSMSAFIRARLMAGEAPADVCAAAQKEFPQKKYLTVAVVNTIGRAAGMKIKHLRHVPKRKLKRVNGHDPDGVREALALLHKAERELTKSAKLSRGVLCMLLAIRTLEERDF